MSKSKLFSRSSFDSEMSFNYNCGISNEDELWEVIFDLYFCFFASLGFALYYLAIIKATPNITIGVNIMKANTTIIAVTDIYDII